MRKIVVKALQAVRLNRVAHHIYYSRFHGFRPANAAILPAVKRAFEAAEAFGTTGQGDYYEFGIFKGYSFWYAQHISTRMGMNRMRYFGFDSFAGLPDVSGIDATRNQVFYEGQYCCSRDTVEANLESAGVDWDRTHLVPGYYCDSLTEATRKTYSMGQIAVALIDCDLYASTSEVLAFISGMLMNKTMLLFDDWNCFDQNDDRGQRRAFREFLCANPEYTASPSFCFSGYGQSFVMHKKEIREVLTNRTSILGGRS